MRAGDATASWSYTTATIRASNNATANSLTIFSGLPEEYYDLQFEQKGLMANAGAATTTQLIGIGYNSTTTVSGTQASNIFAVTAASGINLTNSLVARYIAPPAIGVNVITALEGGSTTDTFYGTEANMLLSASWMA